MTEYITVREAANILNVTPSQVYRLIHRGTIPHIVLPPRTYRIPRTIFFKWLAGGLIQEKK